MEGLLLRISKYAGQCFAIYLVGLFMLYISCNLSFTEYLIISGALFIFITYLVVIRFFAWNFNLQSRKPKSSIMEKLKEYGFYQVSDFPLYCTDSSVQYAQYVVDCLKNINENQKKQFIEKGFVIIVEDYSHFEEWGFTKKTGAGLFDCSKKMILLSQSSIVEYISTVTRTPEFLFKKAFYHEWGHFLDYMYGLLSDTPAVYLKYKEKKNKFIQKRKERGLSNPFKLGNSDKICELIAPYELTNAAEYFAEQYAKYKNGLAYVSKFALPEIIDLKDIFEKIEKE